MSCIMDFPQAWEFVRKSNFEDHDEKCSYRVCRGGLLCDCYILWNEYDKRKEANAQHR